MRERLGALVRDGATRLGVAGGDGTIGLAAQELAGTEVALGIVPLGTMNNFARCVGIPLDIEEALTVLAEGRVVGVDLGRVGDHYFTESAGVGLFADALAAYGPQSRKSLWRLARAVIPMLVVRRSYRLRLRLDGHLLEERAVLCAAANCDRMALAEPIAPGARVGDGKLDVVVIGDLSGIELLRYYRAVREARHLELPKVQRHRAREVEIETVRPARVHVNDTIIGRTPVTIAAAPDALRILSGQDGDPSC
jgi:diacylglycerol kinase family enzyme